MLTQSKNALLRVLQMSTNIHSNELRATVVSFLMVFILMASYFVLRPVRDAMASDWTDSEVSFLWNIQFFISAAIIAGYGWLITRLRFIYVVPMVYAIFAISFVGFYALTPMFANPTLIEKTFYLWVSAFSLFHLSVFWSLMADTFSKDQGERVFAVIASGGSAGAILGPMIPTMFADSLGIQNLMLIAALGLLLVVPLVFWLYQLRQTDLDVAADSRPKQALPAALGGKWWAGFHDLIGNRYLMAISAFILLYVFIGSFVYFEQKNILSAFDRTQRTQILGGIDWIVNTLTFVLAFFVTNRVVIKLGMITTLMLLPLALVIGMLALAAAPLVVVLVAIQVTRRAGNYALTRPAREMLFTQVTQEQRFKSKPVIDVVVYRGGDAVSGSLFALLSDGIGLGLAAIALVGAGVSAVWAWLAFRLGLHYQGTKSAQPVAPATTAGERRNNDASFVTPSQT